MITISLCMIVRDEETNLKKCLNSIYPYIDEIIIVDTGSRDSTKEVARQYTNKVYDYKWNNSFADARNYSISKAKNEYILVIDSDEIVESIDIDEIKRLIEQNPDKIGRLFRINEYTRKGISYKYNERVNRLFSKEYFKYKGIIHEQIVTYDEFNKGTYQIPLNLRHNGYEGDLEIRKKKTIRNIKLLEFVLKDTPDDPYIIYQLGKSYYMEEDYLNACNYFGQALCFDLDIHLEYVQDMIESYGYSLLNSDQYEKAMQLLNIYEEFEHSADFTFLIALILMNNGKFQEAIDEFLKATNKKDCKMEGANDYLAFYNIGVIFECLGDKKCAMKYYNKCADYKLARERLK